MATLHGSWIRQPQASYFWVWGEVWRVNPSLDFDANCPEQHPLAMTVAELEALVRSRSLAWQPPDTAPASP
ncbi:MAG: hypothetical protein SAJ12_19100, partial [Jaaginema sp. PMC 1079.18]|nr:hypothetical protein [Jaaginema sp. PMC 1079.18]